MKTTYTLGNASKSLKLDNVRRKSKLANVPVMELQPFGNKLGTFAIVATQVHNGKKWDRNVEPTRYIPLPEDAIFA